MARHLSPLDALKVFILDRKILGWLSQNDPKALEQARMATALTPSNVAAQAADLADTFIGASNPTGDGLANPGRDLARLTPVQAAFLIELIIEVVRRQDTDARGADSFWAALDSELAQQVADLIVDHDIDRLVAAEEAKRG